MASKAKYTSLYISILLLGMLVYFTWPWFQYYIDPDATAYLTIAKRYAAGDIELAINGYWSPLGIWGTVFFMKWGMAPFAAAILFNTLGAVGVLIVTHSFLKYFQVNTLLQWLLELSLAIFLWYAVYYQSFDDLWEVCLLLAALRLLLVKGFTDIPILWIIYGITGALAYYAKAYVFPFFVLNTVFSVWFLIRSENDKPRFTTFLKISTTSIGVFLFLSLPWIYMLYSKYGIWMTSTAGKLNMSWYMLGHPEWKEGIKLLVPPAYPDSPYYWEDPWLANGDTPMFWESWEYMGRQVLRSGYNVLLFLQSTLKISVFLPVIWFALAIRFLKGKIKSAFPPKANVVLCSMLLFPLPFFLINFEPRYIWYILPLSMIMGALMIQSSMHFPKNLKLKKVLVFLFPLSFAIYPIWDVGSLKDKGKAEYELAQDLKEKDIQGSWASNISYGPQMQDIARLAYFSGNPHYYRLPIEASFEQLLTEMNRYDVKYYYYFNAESQQLPAELSSYLPVYTNKKKGLTVYLVNP